MMKKQPDSPHILIADDEHLLLRVMARQFRGNNVHVASNVQIALGILESQPINVILTDYRMPGDDGLVLLEVARRRFPRARRFMMSGLAPRNLEELMRIGIIERYFSKPLDLSIIAEIKQITRPDVNMMPRSAHVSREAHG